MGESGNSEQFSRDVFPGELSPSELKESMGSEYDPTFGGTRDAMPWDSPQMPKRESDFVVQIAAPVEMSTEQIVSAVTATEEAAAPNESRIFNEWYTLSEEFAELQKKI